MYHYYHCGRGRVPGAADDRPLRALPRLDQHRLAGAMSPRTRQEGRSMPSFTGVLAALAALADRLRGADPERGDVPGWVMITVMTAGLVPAILIPFQIGRASGRERAYISVVAVSL